MPSSNRVDAATQDLLTGRQVRRRRSIAMRLKEFQFLVKEMWDRLEERGVKVKRILPEDSVEENTSEKKNTSEDKQVTIGAIFMPPRINRREKWLKEKRLRDEEIKKKRHGYKNKKAEEDNNDSE